MNNFQDKANFIWQVADDILRGTFKQHEYGDVILPFVTLRRLDCVLEDHKDEVIKTYKKFKDKLPDPTPLFDRKIKIQTGAKSQTVNICTKENKFGTYEYTVRLHPPFFVKPDTLVPVGVGFFEDTYLV